MKISLISFTKAGAALCGKLAEALGDDCEAFAPARFAGGRIMPRNGALSDWVLPRFEPGRGLVFVGAAGIAVRAVARFIQDKQSDPAVVCVDEGGSFAISLLSGHIGGANALAERIAKITGGTPVISTATDVNGLWSPDKWASENGCHISDISAAKAVSAALLDGETVGLQSDFALDSQLPEYLTEQTGPRCGVVISFEKRKPYPVTLNLIPTCLVVGVGCRKNVGPGLLEERVLALLRLNRLPLEAVAGLATIHRKTGEPAIIAFCEKYGLPLFTYSAEELEGACGSFSESAFVRDVVGVGNVCERAAALAGGGLIVAKTVGDGIALAVGGRDWRANL